MPDWSEFLALGSVKADGLNVAVCWFFPRGSVIATPFYPRSTHLPRRLPLRRGLRGGLNLEDACGLVDLAIGLATGAGKSGFANSGKGSPVLDVGT